MRLTRAKMKLNQIQKLSLGLIELMNFHLRLRKKNDLHTMKHVFLLQKKRGWFFKDISIPNKKKSNALSCW